MLRLLLRLLYLFVRRYWKICVVIGLTIIAGLVWWWQGRATVDINKAAFSLPLSYTDITPGSTTHTMLVEKYGVFETEYESGDYTVYTYPSKYSRYAPDRIFLKNDIVVMKELSFNPLEYKLRQSDFTTVYGKPTKILFDQSAISVGIISEVWFYERYGIAVYSRTDSKLTTRIQYFIPISLKEFKEAWGDKLTETEPTPLPLEKHTH